ncbi:alpha-tubulin suppressor-like RCC1 family protein [Melghiribacillus thermohalophilus]|uniref:Alpha-tubulin suppressor-like RCC1 family protein n=1 Tax=Melghiribacillus thermohalophilus TaxID=1324956 RepID=A0A4R3MQR6_9BACI|nr:immunoglobulin-like domain-containing protein [Melghiribacillus thermohalophilus]TCT17252.1 alpha-tubulin suppressor-like RCC1 family protein [Melghiribacillus thermohalophilus]
MFQKHKKEAKKFFVMIGKYLLITFLILGNLLSGFPFVPEQATAQPGNPGNKIIPKIIDADIYHTVGIKSDGSGTAVGRSDRGQLNVGQWTDLVEVAAGLTHTVGLKSDGTVVATGNNGDGQTEVGDWTDIVQVDAGSYHTVGLKSDGTVVAVGQNVFGQIDVDDWTDIVQISAGNYHTVGLKSDGTVVAVGNDEYDDPYDIPIDVDDWTDIVQIEAGAEHTIGLKSDGTVVRAGYHEYIYQVNGWTDIVQIAAGKRHTVGLKSDGTVLRTEVAFEDLGDVSWWSDIVRIRAGYDNTIGVRNDGKIFVAYHTGTDSYGRSNITNWTVKTFVPKSPPDIITPGVQEVGSQVTLSWSDVEDWGYGEDTREYHLQLYDGSSWRDLARNLTSTSWTGNLPGDVHTSKARVRVQAETEYGASAYTKSDTFRIGPPVPPYDLVYPTVSNEEKVIIEGKAEEDVTVEIDNGDITVNGTPDENGNFAIEVPLRTNQENTLILKAAVNGFESDPVSITVTHDDIPPAPPAIDVEKEGWTNDDHVTVTIEEGTDHESGIERTEYRLDEGEWQTYSDPFTVDSEGETLVTARSVDVAGNQSDETIQMIQIDRTPPTAPTINLSPEGWTNEEQVTVTIEDGTEDLSGVSHTEYRIGEGDWEVYEGPFTVDEEGETTITARTIDEVGHVGAETEKTVQIDWTPPAAPTINLDPEGWTNEEQVTVTIEDGTEDLSGVSHTEYRVGEGDWQVYEGPFTVQEEGETTITARTVDNVGYVGAEAEKTVQIDWMQPKAPTINLDPEGWTNEEQVTVTIEDGVVGTSGVQKTMFKIGEDGQEEEYTGSFTITDEGETKIYAYTVNNAGVKGEIKEVTVQINRNRPNIILKGDNPISLEVGDDYVDPGAEAYDDIDGDITDSIVIDDRLVDPLRLGNYEVIYTVTDSAGNIAQKKRIINVMDTTKPDITLNGPNPVTVEVGDHYDDEGATAWDNYDGDLTEDIEIVNEVDTENIGTYNVTYRVMDSSGNIETAQRTVHVVDTTPPSIILKGDNPLTIHYGESYEEPGYEVVDRSGEQLNDQVEVSGELDTETIGEYTLTYNVKDSSGNRARAVTRTVHVVDQDHPEITLHEGDSIRLEVGQDYIEPGATAYDDYDGDLTNEIDISGK